MADLDDFFAKKDRKKSKSVKKFATTDELAKKLEDTKQKTDVRPKKDRPAQEGEEGGRAGKMETCDPEEEEEWKEYEETVKDYTGLKLQVLQGGAAASEHRESVSEDNASDSARGKGPWNKPQSEQGEAPPPPPPEEPKPKEAPKSQAYVPPVARSRPEPLRRTPAASKNAPDIHNDDFFPQLGASGGGKRGGGWSTAAAGGQAPRTATRQPLQLGNRFTELQDDS